mmetsp:Transcript_32106/g.23711  ORF Transcript_32106/g.23711 Transcript_32106/m.23711 type:complete len:111 (-) Transcript_32106:645-977(-)|eukprot:CAMPEP_0202963064 /NCGR_PEP_ID=MMETSP1396-20130829/7061_1 /ASSEMBLY_ACC=CAM_ASM_000872 /TAXON_ID= /ORGANISM="Pseudokeronopsis sp., Strain Brazil" /LENGTH=110 /DNA_ID=CAMNT_0049683989 /DNA_START=572 /DNA_END=904 /DNA_ORIENTATION=-
MTDMHRNSVDGHLSTSRIRLDALEQKISLLITKIQQMSNGQVDAELLKPTSEVVAERRKNEELPVQSSQMSKESAERLQRLSHQLEELKKSYFKKMKEVDAALNSKASKD